MFLNFTLSNNRIPSIVAHVASVAKWLTHPTVTRASAGSNPVARPIPIITH